MEYITQFIELFLHLDKSLSSVIQTYGSTTYIILFLVILCETGLVVLPFLPGDSLLFAAGAFAAKGDMNVATLFMTLCVAAILGDSINYEVGRIIGPRIAQREKSRYVNKEHIAKTHQFYEKYGAKIKWNPAIKSANDRACLIKALNDNRIDIIATDHAPHTEEEKGRPYLKMPSGGPLVEHSLVAMLEMSRNGKLSMEKVVEKMCHAPADLFGIEKRGYIRKGYKADLVLVDTGRSTKRVNEFLNSFGKSSTRTGEAHLTFDCYVPISVEQTA